MSVVRYSLPRRRAFEELLLSQLVVAVTVQDCFSVFCCVIGALSVGFDRRRAIRCKTES